MEISNFLKKKVMWHKVMDKEYSLKILNKCLYKITRMSQEEFVKGEKEKGLDNIDLIKKYEYDVFKIIM